MSNSSRPVVVTGCEWVWEGSIGAEQKSQLFQASRDISVRKGHGQGRGRKSDVLTVRKGSPERKSSKAEQGQNRPREWKAVMVSEGRGMGKQTQGRTGWKLRKLGWGLVTGLGIKAESSCRRCYGQPQLHFGGKTFCSQWVSHRNSLWHNWSQFASPGVSLTHLFDPHQTRQLPHPQADSKLPLFPALIFLFPFLPTEFLSSWNSTCQILPTPSWTSSDVTSVKPSLLSPLDPISACETCVFSYRQSLTWRWLRAHGSKGLGVRIISLHLLLGCTLQTVCFPE